MSREQEFWFPWGFLVFLLKIDTQRSSFCFSGLIFLPEFCCLEEAVDTSTIYCCM